MTLSREFVLSKPGWADGLAVIRGIQQLAAAKR